MNVIDVERLVARKSPIDVRIFRYLFRVFCFHTYENDLAIPDSLVGPILVSECEKCGNRKYKSMDGT